MGPFVDDDFDVPSRFADRGGASWSGGSRFERDRPSAHGGQLAGHCGRGYGPPAYYHHHHYYRPYGGYYPRHDCYYDPGPGWGMYYGGPRSSFYFSF